MKENEWLACEDPLRMVRYLLRYPQLRPSGRKRILVACACARHVWDRITSAKARRLVEYWEQTADDLAWLDRVNAIQNEVQKEARVTGDPATAVALTYSPLPVVQAARAVPGVTPASLGPVIRDLFGNPFRPPAIDPRWLQWDGETVLKAARAVYEESAFDQLPVLADALEPTASPSRRSGN
jgi:hypothetical protein